MSKISDMNFNRSPVVAVGCGYWLQKMNIILFSLVSMYYVGTVKKNTVTWIIFILPL